MFPRKEGDRMEESARDQIRSFLKEFGVRADETIVTHLAKNEDVEHLYLRIILEDLTPYDEHVSISPLSLTVEGEILRTKTS
jgi:hypothetical protein